MHAADGTNTVRIKGMQRCVRMVTIDAMGYMMVVCCIAIDGISDFAMIARFDTHLGTIPTSVLTLGRCEAALRGDHHIIAQCQRTIIVVILTGTDSTHSCLVASRFGDDRSSDDGYSTAVTANVP